MKKIKDLLWNSNLLKMRITPQALIKLELIITI